MLKIYNKGSNGYRRTPLFGTNAVWSGLVIHYPDVSDIIKWQLNTNTFSCLSNTILFCEEKEAPDELGRGVGVTSMVIQVLIS